MTANAMQFNRIIDYQKQRKAKLGEEIIISKDSRNYGKFSRIHDRHIGKVIGGKQRARKNGLSIKWHYRVQCTCNDTSDWLTASGFKKKEGESNARNNVQ